MIEDIDPLDFGNSDPFGSQQHQDRMDKYPPSTIRPSQQQQYSQSGMLASSPAVTFPGFVPQSSQINDAHNSELVFGGHGQYSDNHPAFQGHQNDMTRVVDDGISNHRLSAGGHHQHPGDYMPDTEPHYSVAAHDHHYMTDQDKVHDISSFGSNAVHNCLDVANHVDNCPVCSQIYSSGNTMFYIIIAVLVLIIILLFIKVIDQMKTP